jgi:ribosomal protein S11
MPSKKMSHLDERAKITIRSVTTTMSFRPSGAPASPSEASANESEAKESENEEWVTESEVFVSGSEAGESMIASASLATVLNSL